MSDPKTQERRKKLLLNPRFQLTVIAYFAALSVITMAIFYGSTSYFFWKFYQMGINSGLAQDHIFFRFLSEQKLTMNLIFLVTTTSSLAILVFGGLVLSHKIAGPIYRFTQYLKILSQGKHVAQSNFRKTDFFPEIEEEFNKFLKYHNQPKSDSKDKAA